jgi:hypothetical protein
VVNTTLIWVGGLCSLLSALGVAIAFLFIGDVQRGLFWTLWLVASLLLLPAAVGWSELLRDQQGLMPLVVPLTLLGLVFYGLAQMAGLAMARKFWVAWDQVSSEPFGHGPPSDELGLETFGHALLFVSTMARVFGGVLLYAAAMGLVAYHSLGSPAVPNWIGWIGLAAAIVSLGVIGFMVDWAGTFFQTVERVSLALSSIWLLLMGLIMLRPL